MTIGFYDLWHSSPFLMTVLFFCSILLVATTLERAWCYLGPTRTDEDLCRSVQTTMLSGNHAMAVQQAGQSTTFIARALLEIVSQASAGKEFARQEFEDLWLLRKEEVAEAMRSRLVVFGTLSFVTPLIGLMGSVLGIHHSFHSIALTGIGGPSVVAAGVSEALLCTLVGVSVAVPAMILHNAFASVLSRRMSHWDRIGYHMLQALKAAPAEAGKAPKRGGDGSK